MLLILIFVGLVVWLVYNGRQRRRRKVEYFEKKGIPFIEPSPPYAFLKSIFTGSLVTILQNLHRSKPNEKFFGFYDRSTPAYFLRDPNIVKKIAIKDFEHFMDHRPALDPTHDTFFGNMLILLNGKKWRDMRSTLTPAFTGNKMRLMFELISKCGAHFAEYFQGEHLKRGVNSLDMKEIFTKYTNDVIASCAFGIQCDSLRDPDNMFYSIGRKFLDLQSFKTMLNFAIINYVPRIAKYFNLTFFNKECKAVFTDIIMDNMRKREEENIVRPDMIQLLIELKKGQLKRFSDENPQEGSNIAAAVHHELPDSEQAWTDDELIPQCFIFFLAGFESSSTLMVFTAYELATNPDVQSKLQSEIDDVNDSLDGRPFTYEHLQQMKYLDMVVAETLRLWPPTSFTDRYCIKDYLYKDEDAGIEFTIDKGSVIWIPIYCFHRDEHYFPNPEIFDPERFSEENKSNIDFGAYIPFGVGPRNCIGSRFALMETKVILYHLLSKFSFEVCEETHVPIKLKRALTGLIPDTVKLSLKLRQNVK